MIPAVLKPASLLPKSAAMKSTTIAMVSLTMVVQDTAVIRSTKSVTETIMIAMDWSMRV